MTPYHCALCNTPLTGGADTSPLTCGSLFTGIAGMDLAAQWAGFEIGWQVENDPFCIAVLEHHYPDVQRVRDVRDAGKHNLTPVPFIFGGFPCQDISLAGRGAGILAGAQSGLWREFARLIGELRPRVVLVENVPAITSRGGTIVLSDFATLGYDAKWGIISAADAGASHLRERWFCVAYASSADVKTCPRYGMGENKSAMELSFTCCGDIMADSHSAGLEVGRRIACNIGSHRAPAQRDREHMALAESKSRCVERRTEWEKPSQGNGIGERSSRDAVEPHVVRTTDGLSAWLDGHPLFPAPQGEFQYDWEAPRVASGVRNRRKRLHALGNAVVPQVVYPLMVMCRELVESTQQDRDKSWLAGQQRTLDTLRGSVEGKTWSSL